MTWFSGVLLPDTGYQPRHRSTRRTGNGDGRLGGSWHDDVPEPESGPASADSSPGPEPANPAEDHPAPDFLDQMTIAEVRRILEGCALDDLTTVVPELVQLIAHSSHTPDTLLNAWNEFEGATRDVYALQLRIRNWSAFFRRDELGSHPDEDAIAIMLSYADDAWRLITRGALGAQAPAAVSGAAVRIR